MFFVSLYLFWCFNDIIIKCYDDDTSTDLIQTYSLSANDIGFILDAHNSVRSKENATDMQYMNWSNELSILASNWSRKCTFAHRHKTTRILNNNHDVGETIYFTTADIRPEQISWSRIMDHWYEQKSCYDFKTGQCHQTKCVSKRCGHYVQIVRNDTNFVGCGLSKCNRIGTGNLAGYIFVCNYFKFANWVDSELDSLPLPYTPSNVDHSICSQCPKTMPTCYYNLCRNCLNQTCQITTTTQKTTVSTTDRFNLVLADGSKNVHYPFTKSFKFVTKSYRTTTNILPLCQSSASISRSVLWSLKSFFFFVFYGLFL